jgi:hypothetical protein
MHARNPASNLRRFLESLLLAALLLLAGERPLRAVEAGDAEASLLLANAEQRLAMQTIEMRRVAIAQLERRPRAVAAATRRAADPRTRL